MALRRIKGSGITDGTVGADDLESTLDLSGKTVTLPAASVTAHVTAFDDNQLKEEIALLGFRTAANGSLAKYNLVDQTIDAFEDATGVDAGGSTDEARNASNYYSGVTVSPEATTAFTTVETTTWTSPAGATSADYLVVAGGGGSGGGVHQNYAGGGGGGGGVRHGSLSVTGSSSYTVTVGDGGIAGTSAGNTAGGQGGASVFSTITSTGGGGGGTSSGGGLNGGGGGGNGGGAAGGAGAGNTPSTSPSQGKNGGTSSWYNAGAGGGGGNTGSTGGSASQSSGGNGGAGYNGTGTSWIGTSYGVSGWFAGGGGGGYRNYHGSTSGTGGQGGGANAAAGGSAGTANTGGGAGGHSMTSNQTDNGAVGGTGIVLIHTDAINIYNDMTLISNATTAEDEPTKGDLVMTYTNGAGTASIGDGTNGDIRAFVSRDDGTTWTQLTLASQGSTGAHTILTAHDLDISGQPSGTDMRYKITTHNQSATKATRVHAVSLGWS